MQPIKDTANSGVWYFAQSMIHYYKKYLYYLHITNTVVFTTYSAINQTIFHLSSTIIMQVNILPISFIYHLARTACNVRQLVNEQQSQIS